MIWVLFALMLSLVTAIFAEANRFFKMDGARLNFWRIVVMLLLITPVMFVVQWPAPSMLYVSAALAGTVMAVSPAVRMALSANKKGRVSTLFMPIEAFVGFGLWLMLDENLRHTLLASPIQLGTVLFSMLMVTLALAAIRRNDAGWQIFIIVAPLGVMHALSGVFAKYVFPLGTDAIEAVLVFIFISNIWALALSTSFLAFRKNLNSSLLPPGMMRAALVYGVFGLIGQVCFFNAVRLAPSPGYVVAIAMLAPVWVMIFHKSQGWKDDANPIAGLVMVGAAVLLVLVSTFQ